MKIFIIFILSLFLLNSCGIYKKTDARQVSPNATDRVKKNMEEGKTFRLSNIGGWWWYQF
jgi:hypothetical protein